MASRWLLVGLLIGAGGPHVAGAQEIDTGGDSPFDPPAYVVYRAEASPTVDGKLDEAAWQRAPWTHAFVDIRGEAAPAPSLSTRAKMLWDDDFFYIAAELEEPHVWATLTARDAPIYRDNAFEVFIDPDGDTHNYYEIEVNALETVWDLMIVQPYRDGGPSISAWDIRDLDVAVRVEGTLNDPANTDEGWNVELALPWDVLEEAARGGRPPRVGEQWRLNLARAQWPLEVVGGAYRKEDDAAADWWVWAPQGAVDMHRPERWGYVQFASAPAGGAAASFELAPNEQLKWALRRLYYRQRDYYAAHGRYAGDLAALDVGSISVDSMAFDPVLQTTQSGYEITVPGAADGIVHIRHDGKVWVTD